MVMKPVRYLLCQMELEGIRILGDHLIARVSSDTPDFPLMIIACTADGQRLTVVDDHLPRYLRTALLESKPEFSRGEAAVRILEVCGIIARANEYQTHIFPEHVTLEPSEQVKCLATDDPRVKALGMGGLPGRVYAIEKDGQLLSACVSSRQNHRSAEAWVVTHPRYRRKGYGRSVVAAWGMAAQAEGLIPFYSHDVRNEPSALLAQSLGLSQAFTETVIERAV